MDCRRVRQLLQDELDRPLTPDDARVLRKHTEACPGCAREREALADIDAALSEAPIERAPRWLPSAVAREIAHESAVRRRVEPLAVAIAAAAGAVSTAIAIARAVGSGSAAAVGETATRAATGLGSFMQSLMTMPGVPTAWSEHPGIAGLVWGLAIASVAFLAVSAYRFSRELSLEWR
jgi:predicted anti-sigma-YlaC factor YlaD